MPNSDHPTKIVVGVNGSRSSQLALTWALRQAQLTAAELHAVISTWSIPANHDLVPVLEKAEESEGADWPDLAQKVLDEALDEAVGGAGIDGICRHIVRGHPARVLLETAADADLLVVGGGGDGSPGSSLSPLCQDLIARAPCPVVVVRDTVQQRQSPAAPKQQAR